MNKTATHIHEIIYKHSLTDEQKAAELVEAFAEDEPVGYRGTDMWLEDQLFLRYGLKPKKQDTPVPPTCGTGNYTTACDLATTFKKEETADQIKIKALKESWEHWKEICEIVGRGSLDVDMEGSACACCQEYAYETGKCVECPLKGETGGWISAWCCNGLWKDAKGEYLNHPSSSVDFPTLLKACEAVRDYIKDKLDEAKGVEFGVGDIVKRMDRHSQGEVCMVTKVTSKYLYSENCYMHIVDKAGEECCFPKDVLKLLLPASKIPKELDGIRCEPKGDVVELDNGDIGMVVCIAQGWGVTYPIDLLMWDGLKDEFHRELVKRNQIHKVIWPCQGEGVKWNPTN